MQLSLKQVSNVCLQKLSASQILSNAPWRKKKDILPSRQSSDGHQQTTCSKLIVCLIDSSKRINSVFDKNYNFIDMVLHNYAASSFLPDGGSAPGWGPAVVSCYSRDTKKSSKSCSIRCGLTVSVALNDADSFGIGPCFRVHGFARICSSSPCSRGCTLACSSSPCSRDGIRACSSMAHA
jgi:hypothetical protein